MRCCCCRQEVGTAAEKGPTSERNRQDRTMMSSGEVLPNHSKSRRFADLDGSEEGRRRQEGREIGEFVWLVNSIFFFRCWRGGLVRAKRDGMFCPMPLLGDASLPTTQLGLAVVLRVFFARAVHLSRANERKGCETAQGVLMVKWFLPRLSCRRGLASDRRIHGCCVKKAVEGVGAVKICGI